MKYSAFVKCIAILLTAVCLVLTVVSAVGIIAMGYYGFYHIPDYKQWYEDRMQTVTEDLAVNLVDRYTDRQLRDGQWFMTDEDYSHIYGLKEDGWDYQIQKDEKILDEKQTYGTVQGTAYTYSVPLTSYVRVDSYEDCDVWFVEDGQDVCYKIQTVEPCTVTIQVEEDALRQRDGIPMTYIEKAYGMKNHAIVILIVSVLGVVSGMIYLCCAAGRSPGSQALRPGGLNRMPLDAYMGIVCILLWCFAFLFVEAINYLITSAAIVVCALLLLGCAVVIIGFLFALAAQIKMKNLYWWHHSVTGWLLGTLWKGIRFVFRGAGKIYAMLPVVWKRIAIVMGLLFALLLVVVFRYVWVGFFMLLFLILGCGALFCYDTYAFGTVIKGAKQMAQGHLDCQISTKYLFGNYKDHAEHLNAMAEVATLAAKNQMRSERMKTELITNVSHDIKTPLTSIINYVDLLEKPHTPEEQTQYLEVLDRQSQRLKKLLEDLLEMSKATTGNMNVEITQLNAVETVNQALGEFADKLALVQLTPVVQLPKQPVFLQADGRLTWRVLSNLLGNVVKYALPGTRVYVDLWQDDRQVYLSIKNISREPLNVSADELTERFVRGDASRNTEGSGLGLNIAQSLMELQKGKLQLLVDGDLFKVTLVFLSQR